MSRTLQNVVLGRGNQAKGLDLETLSEGDVYKGETELWLE